VNYEFVIEITTNVREANKLEKDLSDLILLTKIDGITEHSDKIGGHKLKMEIIG